MRTSKKELRKQVSRPSSDQIEDRIFKYFISYALLLLFCTSSVFSTTDIQLLEIKQGIKLPLIDASTSITGFYVVISMVVWASAIFIAREFYNLEALKHNTTQTSTFIFSIAGTGDNASSMLGVEGALDRKVLDEISKFVFFISGPVVLILLLFRFADTQNRLVFAFQSLLLISSIYFSAVFYFRTARLSKTKITRTSKVISFFVAG